MGAVDVIRLERNLGGAARSAGLRDVEAPYVALCDDDSWFAPGALRVAGDLLDRHRRLAVVHGHILVGPEERPDPSCEEMTRARLPAADGQPGHPPRSFIACAVVVRRAAVLEVGGFSEGSAWAARRSCWAGISPRRAGRCPMCRTSSCTTTRRRTTAGPKRREQFLRNALLATWLRRPARTAAARTFELLLASPRDRFSARGVARAVAGAPWVLRAAAPRRPDTRRHPASSS